MPFQTWYNSIESLSQFNKWIQVLLVLFGFLTAIAAALALVTGNKISQLKQIEEENLKKKLHDTEASAKLLGENLSKTIEQQKDTEQSLREELKITNQKLAQSKNRIPPRMFSVQQREVFVSALRSIGSKPISIRCIHGDSESMNFASEIKSYFESANWIISEFYPTTFSGVPQGLLFITHSENDNPDFLGVLLKSFEQAGFPIQKGINPKYPPKTLLLIVGENPAVLDITKN